MLCCCLTIGNPPASTSPLPSRSHPSPPLVSLRCRLFQTFLRFQLHRGSKGRPPKSPKSPRLGRSTSNSSTNGNGNDTDKDSKADETKQETTSAGASDLLQFLLDELREHSFDLHYPAHLFDDPADGHVTSTPKPELVELVDRETLAFLDYEVAAVQLLRRLLSRYGDLFVGFLLRVDYELLYEDDEKQLDSFLGKRAISLLDEGRDEGVVSPSLSSFRLDELEDFTVRVSRSFMGAICKIWFHSWAKRIGDMELVPICQPPSQRKEVELIKVLTGFVNEFVGAVRHREQRIFLLLPSKELIYSFMARYLGGNFPVTVVSFSEEEVCHIHAIAE